MGRTNPSTIVPGTIQGPDISLTANIFCESMRHAFKPGTCLGFAIGATPTSRQEIVYVASGSGTLEGFYALLNDTGSSTDIDFDLLKNGVSVLGSAINITNADTDREVVEGTISNLSFVAGDVYSISMTVTSSTGAQGPFAFITLQEYQFPQ